MMFFVYTMKLCDELLGTSIPIYEIMIEFYERLASWDLGKNSGRIIHNYTQPMQVSAGEETQAAAAASASNNLEGHKIRVYSCLQNENLKEEEDACNKGP